MGCTNKLVRAFIALVCFVTSSSGSYVITVPKTWFPGGELQVCVQVNNPKALPGEITVSIENGKSSANQQYADLILLMQESIEVPQGNQHLCANITLPHTAQWERSDIIRINGTLDGLPVNHNSTIGRQETIKGKIIVQTDRSQYKPGQTVHFRVLSHTGPLMEISTENYQEIYITNPSGIKIAQWLDVNNSKGLVHLWFELTHEQEEGFYHITVTNKEDETIDRDFKVEEYVLPRFEVTVTPPEYVLATQSRLTFTACAKYHFGEPVKGNIHWVVRNYKTSGCKLVVTMNNTISGCSYVTFKSRDLKMITCDVSKIEATATITDEASGEVESGTSIVQVYKNAVIFETVYQDEFMKPNLPFTLKVLAKLPDGSPASGEPLEICHEDICNNIITPLDGIVKLYLTSPNSQRVVMKHLVSRALLREDSFVHRAKRFHSPSNSSLVIHAPEETIQCPNGKETRLTLIVLFAAVQQESAVVNVQVMSRGKLQYFKSEKYELPYSKLPFEEEFFMDHLPLTPADTTTGFLDIPVTLPLTAAPKIKVLVWYIRDDGEVVSDAREITIKKCLPNKVEFAWSTNRTQPGLTNSLTITSAPGSLCSYGVLGKRLYSETTTQDTETIDSFFLDDNSDNMYLSSSEQANDYKYCRRLSEANPNDATISSFGTDYVDTLYMFGKSGLLIFTNLTLETRPCISLGDYWYSNHRSRSELENGPEANFHETWLWDLAVVPSTGILRKDVEVPQTITEWIGSAVCVHPLVGVGVSKNSSLTTYTSFYIDMMHPPSIKRGEDLLVKILVFNNLQQPLPVMVTLEGSTEYELIEENNTSLPAGQRLSCIGAQDKHVHTIKIRPTTVGQVNIAVRASIETETSLPCRDEFLNTDKKHKLVSSIRVTAEGYLREETWSKFICAKAEGQNSLETADLIIPSGLVVGSEKAWITVEGQLAITLEDLQRNIQAPVKCSNVNEIVFVSNLFIFKYLQATRQVTPEVKSKLLNFTRTGYQRQLLYKRLDGSYSAFGNADDSGSSSLTAYVLNNFAQAKEFIPIDKGSLDTTISWLINNYGNETCAQSIENIHTTESLGHEESSRVPLTANILIALLESGVSASDLTVQKALRCLSQDQSLDYFTMALKAYALALAGNPEAPVVLDQLMKQADVTDTSIKWYRGRRYKYFYSYGDETSGLVILAMLAIDPSAYDQEFPKLAGSLPPRASISNIYANIYNIYTRDKKKAFLQQALATYESTRYQGDLNVNVTVDARDFHHTFFMTESNKSLQQKVSLPILPTNVSFRMKGQGCALIRTILHYNDPKPEDSDSHDL